MKYVEKESRPWLVFTIGDMESGDKARGKLIFESFSHDEYIRFSERTDWLVDKFKMKTEWKIILFVLPCIRQCWGPSRVEEEEEESCEVPHLEASEGSVRRDSGGKFRDDVAMIQIYEICTNCSKYPSLTKELWVVDNGMHFRDKISSQYI